MHRTPTLARRLFDRFEPVHALTYYAPESRSALDELGYRGLWMGYFAARSAPLGVVPTEVVTATFYNFAARHVAKALPAAWDIAPPAAALRAREQSAEAALRRYGVTDSDAESAAELAAKAARSAEIDGRALFAANLAQEWPQQPRARLWHAATLLREHRGDGHVAVLTAEGVSGRECNVLHAAAGRVPEALIMSVRDYDAAQWEHHRASLQRRGVLDATGALTQQGWALKQRIEDATDALALRAFDVLDDAEMETLFQALTPITRKVVTGGDLPEATPMGLNRDELDDDNAHLG